MTTESDLTRKHCVPCEGGIPALTSEEAQAYLANVEGWKISDDTKRIVRKWVVKNFTSGIEFLDRVALLAESEGHHPDLHLEGYRNLRIELSTHAVGGLTENDFILAAKINGLPIQTKSKPATDGA